MSLDNDSIIYLKLIKKMFKLWVLLLTLNI